MDRYLGMINETEKDWQCSRHREIEYGSHMYGINYQRSVYMPVVLICSRIE